jgi:hypothetical protein
MTTPLSVRAYARHRGASHQAVLRAIARGRLSASLTTVDGVTKIADVALADKEWAATTDLSKAPDAVKARAAAGLPNPVPPFGLKKESDIAVSRPTAQSPNRGQVSIDTAGDIPVDPTDATNLATASAREKHWRAELAELNYKQRAGELVNAAEMTAAMADAFSTVRTKLLGVPSKAKQQLSHLTLADLATLDAIVREALDGLATDDLAVTPA